MRILLCYFSFLSLAMTYAQTRADQGILSLIPQQGQEHHIALLQGDTLHLNAQVQSPKKGKIGLIRLQHAQKGVMLQAEDVNQYQTDFVANKSGVYRLWVQNRSKEKAVYSASYTVGSSHKKAPAIRFKHKKDTTYGFSVQQWVNHSKKEVVTVQEEGYYLNSTSNAMVKGGKNRIIIPIQLPEGTQEWYYSFTGHREKAQMEKTMASFQLAAQLSTYADNDQKLQRAVSNLSPPPGANICDVYVLKSETQAKRFREKEEFSYNLPASRENFKSGVVRVKDRRDAFLGIRNPDNLHGIHVGINVTALVLNDDKRLEEVQIPIIRAYKEGVIK